MWSLSRRVVSFGLRMTLQRMQDNITSMHNFRRTFMLPQQQQSSRLSLSRSILTQIKYEPAAPESPKEKEEEEEEEEEVESRNESDDKVFDRKGIGQVHGELKLAFTCKRCGTRNEDKIISKLGYFKGVVIVRCDGCKNNHLIADNLGWFGPENTTRNIETILKQKGENVQRIRDDSEGYFEAVAREEVLKVQRLMKEQQQLQTDAVSEEQEESAKPLAVAAPKDC